MEATLTALLLGTDMPGKSLCISIISNNLTILLCVVYSHVCLAVNSQFNKHFHTAGKQILPEVKANRRACRNHASGEAFSNTLDEQRRVLCGKWLKEAIDLDLPDQNQPLMDDDAGFEPYEN